MKKKRRIIQSILCCIIIATPIVFYLWIITPPNPVQIFRAAERRNLYKNSEILGYEALFMDYEHAVLAEAKHGYLLCEWLGDMYPNVSQLRYYPKQEGITVFSSADFIIEHTDSHQSIPIFVISDNPRAVTAKVTFRDFGASGKQTYEQEIQRSSGGYFLFHIPCNELDCPSRLAFFEGTYSIELYDSQGNLLETYHFPQ